MNGVAARIFGLVFVSIGLAAPALRADVADIDVDTDTDTATDAGLAVGQDAGPAVDQDAGLVTDEEPGTVTETANDDSGKGGGSSGTCSYTYARDPHASFPLKMGLALGLIALGLWARRRSRS